MSVRRLELPHFIRYEGFPLGITMHVSTMLVVLAQMTAVVLAAPATPRPSGITSTSTRATPDKRIATTNTAKSKSPAVGPGNLSTSLKRSKTSTPRTAPGAGTSKQLTTKAKVLVSAQKSVKPRTSPSTEAKTSLSKSSVKTSQQALSESKAAGGKSGPTYVKGIPQNPGGRPTSNVSNMFGSVVGAQTAAGNTNSDAQYVLDNMKGTKMDIGTIKSNFGQDFSYIGGQLDQARYDVGQSQKIMPYIEKKPGRANNLHVKALADDLNTLSNSVSDEGRAYSKLQAATTSDGITAALKQLVGDTNADGTTAGDATVQLRDIGLSNL